MPDWYVSSAAWTAITQFATSHAYSIGDVVRPLTSPAFNANYTFRCTTAGTSSTEPAWPANNNATVTTGGATFTNVSGQSTYGWSAAAGNFACMTPSGAGSSRLSAGDRVFISSDHSESAAAALNYATAISQSFGATQILSVNRAGSVPPATADLTAGGAIAQTASFTALQLDAYAASYWSGLTFTIGGAANSMTFNGNLDHAHYLKNCAIVFTTSTTTASMKSANSAKVTLDNTSVKFNAAAQTIQGSTPFELNWINTATPLAGGTVPTTLFVANGASPITVIMRGVDLSALTTVILNSVNQAFGAAKILLDSCRIASGVTRYGTASIGAQTNPEDMVELVNCYDGTSIIAERHGPFGDLTTELSTTMAGGAQDNVGLFSHKMVSSSRSDKYVGTLDSFWLDVNNTLTSGAHTATVEIISSATLNNDEVWLVLQYEGTTGSPLATTVTSQPTNVLATAAAISSSTATWNNPPATPQRQHLQVTFNPTTAGRLRGQVRLGKPSTTMWINPQIVVT